MLLCCALPKKHRMPFVELTEKALLVLHAANEGTHIFSWGFYTPANAILLAPRTVQAQHSRCSDTSAERKCAGHDCWRSSCRFHGRAAPTLQQEENISKNAPVQRASSNATWKHRLVLRRPISTCVCVRWGRRSVDSRARVKQAASGPGRRQGLSATDHGARTPRQGTIKKTRRAAGQILNIL